MTAQRTMQIENGEIVVRFPYDADLVKRMQEIRGGVWVPQRNAWVFPATPMIAGQVLSSAIHFTIEEQLIELGDRDSFFMRRVSEGGDDTGYANHVYKPWEHQRRAFRWMGLSNMILDHEMGIGKTKTVIDYIVNHDPRRVLVLCPFSVVNVWRQQWKEHGEPISSEREVWATRQEWASSRKVRSLRPVIARTRHGGELLVVLNYESATRIKALYDLLRDVRWNLLVLDECHRLKSPKGVTSDAVYALSRMANRVVGLTGTFMPHSPLDYWSQMRMIEPGVFGLSFPRFKARYAVTEDTKLKKPRTTKKGKTIKSFPKITGFQNEQELAQRMAPYVHTVRKRDVLADLPKVQHVRREVELPEDARRIYDDMEQHFRAELQDGTIATAANALVVLIRLQQLTGGSVKNERGDYIGVNSAKRDALLDLLLDLPQDEPVVVFAQYIEDIEQSIQGAAAAAERRCYFMTGQVKSLDLWKRDARDGLGPVMAAQIDTGGIGVSMVEACQCVLYSIGFNAASYEQAIARVDRSGQTRPVTYTHLLAENTVDDKLYGVLHKKRNMVTAMMDLMKGK